MKEKIQMEVRNFNAAGIDVGSKSHFVAVGQNLEHVKEFGIYHSDHMAMIEFLKASQIKTIAMESTGSYWQSLYLVLIKHEFEVYLVPGSQTKGYRKTDVKDARHLQQLHTLGILSSCFLLDDFTRKMRELCRHRKSIISDCSKYINRIQKNLRMMNLRLDVALSDTVGVSGSKIIEAILDGERDGVKLANLADGRIKKSKAELADALQGNFESEILYSLKDNFEIYKFLQAKINQLDKQISEFEQELDKVTTHNMDGVKLAKKQVKGKNQPKKVPVQAMSYKTYGVDISAIAGVSINTLLTLISEVGSSIWRFKDSKSFVSWLRLAPNNKISGGKVLSSRTPKGSNPLKIALRDAANVIGNQKKGELTAFFKRKSFNKGRCAAITATARKLAIIIYNMITKKEEYDPTRYKEIKVKNETKQLQKAMSLVKKHGFGVIDNEGVIQS